MTNHDPNTDSLIRLAEGELDDTQAARLREAIAGNPALVSRLRTVEAIIAFLREEPATEPSKNATKSARKLFKHRAGVVESVREGVRRIVAALDFDTRLPAAAMGFRGSGSAVQVGFSCDECEIDIELDEASPGVWRCRGQIDTDLPAPFTVRVLGASDRGVVHEQATDERGAFLAELGVGSYLIVIESQEAHIEAGPLLVP